MSGDNHNQPGEPIRRMAQDAAALAATLRSMREALESARGAEARGEVSS